LEDTGTTQQSCENLTNASYGIKAAWSRPFSKTYFQEAVESLDKYTSSFEDIPVLPFNGRVSNKRSKVAADMHTIDPNVDDLEDLYVEEEERQNGDEI